MADKIEKKVHLHAPLERVWEAISDARQFGRWFGMRIDGEFVAGKHVEATIAQTEVDPEVAKMQAAHVGKPLVVQVETVDRMRRFAFRWHPCEPDEAYEDGRQPMTLVTFDLEETSRGVMLTIAESGFDGIPLERRAEAFRVNEDGWEKQTRLVRAFVERDGAAGPE